MDLTSNPSTPTGTTIFKQFVELRLVQLIFFPIFINAIVSHVNMNNKPFKSWITVGVLLLGAYVVLFHT